MLYQKNGLSQFQFQKRPGDAKEKKEQLRTQSERLGALQMKLKENKLPVLVLVEGWGTAGKGSRIASMISPAAPSFSSAS